MGRSGSDIFWFNTKEKFGKKHADKIWDFNPKKDVIIFGSERFGSMSQSPKFLSVDKKSDYKKAQLSDIEFIYLTNNGRLFFNANGDQPGLGNGGLFASLRKSPDLFIDSIGFTVSV
jgi:hypothetical protein